MSTHKELEYLFQQTEEKRKELNQMIAASLLNNETLTRTDILDKNRELDALIAQYHEMIGTNKK